MPLFLSTRTCDKKIVSPVIGVLIQIVVLYGWQYVVIFKLRQFIPKEVIFNYKRIKFFAILPLVYFSFFLLLIASVFANPMNIESPFIGLVVLVIPFHFLTVFSIFHTMYFAAKTIKCVELKRNVTFSDMAGEFFLIWFFLIGVWILQPRINKLIDGNISYTEDQGMRSSIKPNNGDLEVI